MKKVFYLGYYDTPENKSENRNIVLAATNKMTYIVSALEKAGYSVNLVSASLTYNCQKYDSKVVDLCENSSVEEGLKFSKQALETMQIIKKFNSEKIYKNDKIDPTIRYFKVLMNEIFYTLKKQYDGENTIRNLKKMGRYYPVLSQEFIGWLANYSNIKERESKDYKNKIIYNLENSIDYDRAIIDYISGMTDNYIVKTYNEIVSF